MRHLCPIRSIRNTYAHNHFCSYSLYLRMYIITNDIAWIIEIILGNVIPISNDYYEVPDLLQGFVVLAWFVLRPDVLRRIKKRYELVV